ncbi:MAG: hypothetical protein SGCHY_005244, partial [Lobulomycetales sp.]
YNQQKKMEHFLRSLISNSHSISCVEPSIRVNPSMQEEPEEDINLSNDFVAPLPSVSVSRAEPKRANSDPTSAGSFNARPNLDISPDNSLQVRVSAVEANSSFMAASPYLDVNPGSSVSNRKFSETASMNRRGLTRASTKSSMFSQMKGKGHQEREVLVGTPIKEGHVNFLLMFDMLTGIRISVGRCDMREYKEIQAFSYADSDYSQMHKLAFDEHGKELIPNSEYDFKFKDYAPWIFKCVRDAFHVDSVDYLQSLTGKYVLSELGSPGKSGSFFYFSSDYRYIIKTISQAEHRFMRRILRHYYNHVRDNPDTLLSRIFGLHRVKLPGNKKIHFVVMGNVFPPHKDMHRIYDLKGSLTGRFLSKAKQEANTMPVLKDKNWLANSEKLVLGPEKRNILIEQLDKDVLFLKECRIMDYSFLVGVHDLEKGNKDMVREKSLITMDRQTSDSPILTSPAAEGKSPALHSPAADRKTSLRESRATPGSKSMGRPKSPKRRRRTGSASEYLMPQAPTFSEQVPDERKFVRFYQDAGGFQSTNVKIPHDKMTRGTTTKAKDLNASFNSDKKRARNPTSAHVDMMARVAEPLDVFIQGEKKREKEVYNEYYCQKIRLQKIKIQLNGAKLEKQMQDRKTLEQLARQSVIQDRRRKAIRVAQKMKTPNRSIASSAKPEAVPPRIDAAAEDVDASDFDASSLEREGTQADDAEDYKNGDADSVTVAGSDMVEQRQVERDSIAASNQPGRLYKSTFYKSQAAEHKSFRNPIAKERVKPRDELFRGVISRNRKVRLGESTGTTRPVEKQADHHHSDKHDLSIIKNMKQKYEEIIKADRTVYKPSDDDKDTIRNLKRELKKKLNTTENMFKSIERTRKMADENCVKLAKTSSDTNVAVSRFLFEPLTMYNDSYGLEEMRKLALDRDVYSGRVSRHHLDQKLDDEIDSFDGEWETGTEHGIIQQSEYDGDNEDYGQNEDYGGNDSDEEKNDDVSLNLEPLYRSSPEAETRTSTPPSATLLSQEGSRPLSVGLSSKPQSGRSSGGYSTSATQQSFINRAQSRKPKHWEPLSVDAMVATTIYPRQIYPENHGTARAAEYTIPKPIDYIEVQEEEEEEVEEDEEEEDEEED